MGIATRIWWVGVGLSQVVLAIGGGQYQALHAVAAVVCLGCVALGCVVRR